MNEPNVYSTTGIYVESFNDLIHMRLLNGDWLTLHEDELSEYRFQRPEPNICLYGRRLKLLNRVCSFPGY